MAIAVGSSALCRFLGDSESEAASEALRLPSDFGVYSIVMTCFYTEKVVVGLEVNEASATFFVVHTSLRVCSCSSMSTSKL